jgi:glucan phosphoethanolaminetransferase (alkaline phosphatase superfamily)
LNRGLAAALLAIIVLAFVTHGWAASKAAILLAIGAAVAVYRMHRFGVHYARELFVQFLSIPVDTQESHQDD